MKFREIICKPSLWIYKMGILHENSCLTFHLLWKKKNCNKNLKLINELAIAFKKAKNKQLSSISLTCYKFAKKKLCAKNIIQFSTFLSKNNIFPL